MAALRRRQQQQTGNAASYNNGLTASEKRDARSQYKTLANKRGAGIKTKNYDNNNKNHALLPFFIRLTSGSLRFLDILKHFEKSKRYQNRLFQFNNVDYDLLMISSSDEYQLAYYILASSRYYLEIKIASRSSSLQNPKNDKNHLELSKAIFIENAATNVAENASCRLGSFAEPAFDPAKYFDCDVDFRK
uniref:Uncharacterized protein n=1 Tax=Romanomermis culicivorax TaxID=13658 RepID=A0A915J546_ROMCU